MTTKAILLIVALFLLLYARYSGGLAINLAISLSASYFAVKGFSNIFGDFITCDDIDKIQLCNLYLRSFNIDSTPSGNPSTILPSLGTTSVFATDAKWKETVTTLIERAKIIILRIGETEGTLWELKQCVALRCQYKAIFIINDGKQFELLTNTIGEIKASISEPVDNELIAIFFNSLINKWDCLTLHDKPSVKRLYNSVIESLGYKDELRQIRHRRLFYWKYLFSKKNFPETMRPFSLGMLLNSIVYYFYNRWHPATIIYYAVVAIMAQLLRPYIYDSRCVSVPCFFMFASLLLISIVVFVFGPQISWLSKRWPSYEYFKEDNQQLNKILWVFWKGAVGYNMALYIITYIIFGCPYYIG